MEKSRDVKILVISDIHLRVDDSDYVKNLTKDLINLVKDRDLKFNYVIFNGDLAFSGNINEYVKFKKEFLEEFKKVSDNLIILPGNHDISQERIVMNTNSLGPDQLRNFNLKDFMSGGAYDNYKHWDISSLVNNENPIIDPENRIIIKSFNTSQYSLGASGHYLNYKRFELLCKENNFDPTVLRGTYNSTNPDWEKFKKILYGLANFHNEAEEQEMEGLSTFLKNQDIRKKINENYFLLTCAHHPFEWLNWMQRYDNKDFGFLEKERNKSEIEFLTTLSHCHIVGHEHLEPHKEIRKIGNCWYLKMGMFMDGKIYDGISGFGRNFAHIIHIDDEYINLEYLRYIMNSSGNHFWQKVEFPDNKLKISNNWLGTIDWKEDAKVFKNFERLSVLYEKRVEEYFSLIKKKTIEELFIFECYNKPKDAFGKRVNINTSESIDYFHLKDYSTLYFPHKVLEYQEDDLIALIIKIISDPGISLNKLQIVIGGQFHLHSDFKELTNASALKEELITRFLDWKKSKKPKLRLIEERLRLRLGADKKYKKMSYFSTCYEEFNLTQIPH